LKIENNQMKSPLNKKRIYKIAGDKTAFMWIFCDMSLPLYHRTVGKYLIFIKALRAHNQK